MGILIKEGNIDRDIEGRNFIENINKKKKDILDNLNTINKNENNINNLKRKDDPITNKNNIDFSRPKDLSISSKNKELIVRMKEKFLK
jgi:hypothetical protein